MKKLSIDVWSDIACPWCYVGKRRLEAALARFPHRDAVELTWRAFELDPSAPAVPDPSRSYAERLASKYRRSVAEAQGMIDDMTRVAAADGIEMRFDRVQATSTFDGHRLIHLATSHGLGDAAKERLLRAYFTEGAQVSDHATLVGLGVELGLPAETVRTTLASDAYARAVRGEEAEARAYGITGVPCFVFARRLAVSGAQPAEVLLGALTQAWDELPEPTLIAEGAACGPDGCA